MVGSLQILARVTSMSAMLTKTRQALRKSTLPIRQNNGVSWTNNRVTDGTHNSAFPEIAVALHGTIGVLYVDYDTAGETTSYRHHFSRSGDVGVTWTDEILQAWIQALPNAQDGFTWGDYE